MTDYIRNPIINNVKFTVQSRAGACSRRKSNWDDVGIVPYKMSPKACGYISLLWQRRWHGEAVTED